MIKHLKWPRAAPPGCGLAACPAAAGTGSEGAGASMLRRCIALVACTSLARLAGAAPPLIELSTEPLGASCVPRPERIRSAATVATTASGMSVFQGSARPADWSGQFTRSALTVDASGMPRISPPLWEAGALLDVLPDPANARRVYTSKIELGRQTTIPFAWDSLSAAQRTALNRPPPPARQVSDRKGELRLDYLRGDRSLEGSTFRPRGGILGDTVNSTPVHVGAPPPEGRSDGYREHAERLQSRRPAVYLGANDGMLHAFDAGTGNELFAYIPAALFSQLNQLPSRNYAHRAYVDGPASAGEVLLAGVWKTVLVSAMGAGAQAVFALDVTDPATFPAGGGALWEFTDRDDAVLGNVTTLPQIVRVRMRSASSDYRYFALVASGINNGAPDGNADAERSSALFLLALDKPSGEAWRLNRNYYRLPLPAGDTGRVNALGTPALVKDDGGALRYAYAGDLHGNLWRFSFTGSAPWRAAAEGPVFIARDASGQRQPITAQPRVVNAPDGGLLILVGTGRLLDAADRDPSRYAQQSFYAVLDDHASVQGEAGPAGAAWPLARADLAQRVLDGAPGDSTLAVRGRVVSYGGANGGHGWYIDFLQRDSGERSISSPVVADGTVYFNSVLTGAHACAAIASRSYALGTLAGLPPDSGGLPASGEASGLLVADYLPAPPTPVVAGTTRAAGQGNGRVRVGKHIAIVNVGATAAELPSGNARISIAAGRIGWREVANWRELHGAAAREARP
ncbi:PilC/PilY family type IV pilus protein [Pseudoduganella sp. LjRoot289]|uniref:pilus assembly protein n=1 Tax=Pseudoduganella sp. LjRoot289 TaxID=3342314 RepID=UPI003ECD1AE1